MTVFKRPLLMRILMDLEKPKVIRRQHHITAQLVFDEYNLTYPLVTHTETENGPNLSKCIRLRERMKKVMNRNHQNDR